MTAVPLRRPARQASVAAWLPVGAVAGFLAGIAFIALNSWFVTTMGKPELGPFKTIATLAQGPPPPAATIWIGEGIHSALSATFGVIFVLLVLRVRSPGLVALGGLLYGGIIYAVDFQILSRFVGQFSAPLMVTSQPFEVTVHLFFGGLLAGLVLLARRLWPTEEPARAP